jgi:hypothetical protein
MKLARSVNVLILLFFANLGCFRLKLPTAYAEISQENCQFFKTQKSVKFAQNNFHRH